MSSRKLLFSCLSCVIIMLKCTTTVYAFQSILTSDKLDLVTFDLNEKSKTATVFIKEDNSLSSFYSDKDAEVIVNADSYVSPSYSGTIFDPLNPHHNHSTKFADNYILVLAYKGDQAFFSSAEGGVYVIVNTDNNRYPKAAVYKIDRKRMGAIEILKIKFTESEWLEIIDSENVALELNKVRTILSDKSKLQMSFIHGAVKSVESKFYTSLDN